VDLFEQIRRITGDVPWDTFARVMAPNVGQSAVAAHNIVQQLKEWGAHLTKNALLKWSMTALTPTPCDCPELSGNHARPCSALAVLRCDACGRPCCMAHARIDYEGDGICEICIIGAQERGRATYGTYSRPHARDAVPPAPERKPGEMTPGQALKALKLPVTATWQQVRRQYHRLAVKYNADRPQTDKQRAANTERLKKFNAAYEVLRAQYEQKREAA